MILQKMAAILQVDVKSANRFVSSLSKSLQALCHGCMDFDTQTEIIGCPNVNIDCNGKMDCVLNEKVSKSEDNSITFISNSFLAKKDEPKSLSERSCSPIAELNTRSHYQRKDGAYSNTSSQHYRSSGIFSPHSQILRGAHKRPWRGPRRHNTKSSRLQEPYLNQSFHGGTSQHTSFTETSASSSYFDHSNSNPSQTNVCIKTENSESVTELSNPNTFSSNNQPAVTADIKIKPDPDSADTSQSQSNFLQTTADPKCEEQSFIKKEPASNEDQKPEGETFEQTVEGNEANEGFSGAQADYDGSEEQNNSQSMFGDESGDASQFDYDVIKIGDEDEIGDEDGEMEQFTGVNSRLSTTDSNNQATERQLVYQACGSRSDQKTSSSGLNDCFLAYDFKLGQFLCPECGKGFANNANAMRHFKNIHQKVFPFCCMICWKGYPDKSAFESHMVCHGMPMKFECTVCGKKYARNGELKRHVKYIHGVVFNR